MDSFADVAIRKELGYIYICIYIYKYIYLTWAPPGRRPPRLLYVLKLPAGLFVPEK